MHQINNCKNRDEHKVQPKNGKTMHGRPGLGTRLSGLLMPPKVETLAVALYEDDK